MPPTTQRVRLHTDPEVNAKIRNETLSRIIYDLKDNGDEIAARVNQLNEEWDTERVLEANAAGIIIISTILGLKSSRCWFLLTGAVGLFLLQHALQGWCPPLSAIRKKGIRTAEEINNEKTVLKMLRNDFQHNFNDAAEMLNMAEKQ